MLLLDDRVQSVIPSALRERLIFAPDPAPLTDGDVQAVNQSPVKSSLFPDKDDKLINIVALGRQSERKGLIDILQAARSLKNADNVRLSISGPLEASQEQHRAELEALCAAGALNWRDEYVSEEEIRRTYRDADYVLLPYDRSFEGSSGVFSHAAAFGAPLISTDHGCVGYRVKRHGVGFCLSRWRSRKTCTSVAKPSAHR